MHQLRNALLFIILFCFSHTPAFAVSDPAHHAISVTLKNQQIEVHDTLTIHPDTAGNNSLSLILYGKYQFQGSIKNILGKKLVSQGWTIKSTPKKNALRTHGVPLKLIQITKPGHLPWPGTLTLNFNYKGAVFESMPPGKTTGVQLSGASYFYPQEVDNIRRHPRLITFALTVSTPSHWTAVSQGQPYAEITLPAPKNKKKHSVTAEARNTITWISEEPQEEIFLIADRFEKYTAEHGRIKLYTYLIEEDPYLANLYLKTAETYIDFYEKLIGPYPYAKFALVENSRQTGYGMPSFTLLGSKIIRFPFILHTSYPHEILHNWWGNSVYIHPNSGNWSEGLTSYLSDHLLAELEGNGAKYRFQELMKFSNYVSTAGDFPLKDFKARHDMASQAIGYGKWLMVLNMLRVELGDGVFLEFLREFYKKYKFRFASYQDVQTEFETVSGKNLEHFFQQWVMTTGAPELELSSATYEKNENAYSLQLQIAQKNSDATFRFNLPVAVWFKDKELPQLLSLTLEEQAQTFNLEFPDEPSCVTLDPYYDVFRRLDRRETPPSLGQTYGSEEASVVVEEEDPVLLEAYGSFVKSLKLVKRTDDILLPGQALWAFGKNNTLAQTEMKNHGVEIDDTGITLEGNHYTWENHGFALTIRNPHDPAYSMTWVVTDSAENIAGLIRKLPHYGKYGYLVFEGTTNILKGAWPSEGIGSTKVFHPGKFLLPARTPLVAFKPAR